MARKTCRIVAFLLLVVALASASVSAESTPPTRLESYMLSKGLTIVKDYYEVGRVEAKYDDELVVKVLAVYEPGKEAQKVKGIALTVLNTEDSKSQTAYIDADELPALSKSLAYMITTAGQWKNLTREYSEVGFVTKDQCEVGFYHLDTNQSAYIYAGREESLAAFFEIGSLADIKTVIDKATQVMVTK